MKRLLYASICLALLLIAAASVLAAPANLPKVAILATGGTIAGVAASNQQLTGYQAGVLTADQLIAAAPGIERHARLSAEQLANVDSSQMTLDIWLKLAKRINELLETDIDGIVVTHGTDTMEETAYFLNLVVKSDKPVVLVGSMRPSTAISADGPLNLLEAVIIAASPESRCKGVLVALNGAINGARDVTKTNTVQVDTFKSLDLGLLGYVVQSKPVYYRASTRAHTSQSEFNVNTLGKLPKVEIVYGYLNVGTDAIKGVVAGKPAGIVYAGVGDGAIFAEVEKVLIEAAKSGIAVVISSRPPTGITTHEAAEDNDGFISADNLSPQKARVLLMLALTRTKDRQAIQNMFHKY